MFVFPAGVGRDEIPVEFASPLDHDYAFGCPNPVGEVRKVLAPRQATEVLGSLKRIFLPLSTKRCRGGCRE